VENLDGLAAVLRAPRSGRFNVTIFTIGEASSRNGRPGAGVLMRRRSTS
jgi:hypothetical protein